MTDYRELFERLAKCNLPTGVYVGHAPSIFVQVNRRLYTVANERDAPECRAALLMLVDALRKEGWAFEFGDGVGYYAKAHHVAPIAVLGCRSHMRVADDEATAIAECLIAAMGAKE